MADDVVRAEPKPADATGEHAPVARRLVARVAATVLTVLVVLAVLSYHADDDAILAGGLGSGALLHNWVGRFGATFSGGLIAWLGLAAYPGLLLVLLCIGRRAFGTQVRRLSALYVLGALLAVGGTAMLLGVFPDFMPDLTAQLNLHLTPGGAFGERLCSPGNAILPAGLLSYVVNPVGCIIISSALLLLGLVTVWYYDWQPGLRSWLASAGTKWDAKLAQAREARDADRAATAEHRPPPEISAPAGEPGLQLPLPAPPAPPAPLALSPTHVAPSMAPVAAPAPSAPLAARAEPATVAHALPPAAAPGAPRAPLAGKPKPKASGPYHIPAVPLLDPLPAKGLHVDAKEVAQKKQILQETLDSFSIDAQVGEATSGPRVTMFEIKPAPGVKVERISNLQNNFAMGLRAVNLRILAPIPGKDTVGLEVPNANAAVVPFRELMESKAWAETKHRIPLGVGKNIKGEHVILDLHRCPHLLIAGATGSGKSVCMNTLILSLLFRFSPEELKLLLVDPKRVEFAAYNALPHLVTPVVCDEKKVPLALRWAVNQMEWRYHLLEKAGVRDLAAFNARKPGQMVLDHEGIAIPDRLPYIIIIIDELADIMMTAKGDVETSLARIAQKARAVGIHAVIATQRPSVDVLTGVIKANFPTRIAFQVSSLTDSKTILDYKGAETLLGRGDMLYKPPGLPVERIQGAMVGDAEIERVVKFVGEQGAPEFREDVLSQTMLALDGEGADADEEAEAEPAPRRGSAPVAANSFKAAQASRATPPTALGATLDSSQDNDEDLLKKAIAIVLQDRRATTSHLQRRLRIGYNRAATMIEEMERRGIVGPQVGVLPREILMTAAESPDATAADAAGEPADEAGEEA